MTNKTYSEVSDMFDKLAIKYKMAVLTPEEQEKVYKSEFRLEFTKQLEESGWTPQRFFEETNSRVC